MLASELIAQLSKYISKHGDLPIAMYNYDHDRLYYDTSRTIDVWKIYGAYDERMHLVHAIVVDSCARTL